jgi:hypothetical protein
VRARQVRRNIEVLVVICKRAGMPNEDGLGAGLVALTVRLFLGARPFVIRGTALGRARFEEMNEAGTRGSVEHRSDLSLQNQNSPLAGSNVALERPRAAVQ